MHGQLPLYLQVYSTIVKDIFNGTLKKGDKLPSKQALSKQYGVGEGTIKLAVRNLREAGFIHTAKRKAAVITFDLGDPETQARLRILYASRKRFVLDRLRGFNLFVPPAAAVGARLSTPDEIEAWRAALSGLSADRARTAELRETLVRFITDLLKKTGSNILLVLYNEISPFSILPEVGPETQEDPFYPIRVETLRYCREILVQMERREYARIEDTVPQIAPIIDRAREDFLQYLNPVAIAGVGEERPYGFSSLYQTVLNGTIQKILKGEYPEGSLLPTESEMCQEYSVGKVTVRTAYKLLGNLGLTRTVQGRGTRVLTLEERSQQKLDITPETINNIHLFFETLQFVMLCCSRAAVYSAQYAPVQKIEELWRELERQNVSFTGGILYPAVLLLGFALHQTACRVASQVGDFLTGQLYWGFLLEGTAVSLFPREVREINGMCLCAARSLKENREPLAFMSLLEQIFTAVFRVSRECCKARSISLLSIVPDRLGGLQDAPK